MSAPTETQLELAPRAHRGALRAVHHRRPRREHHYLVFAAAAALVLACTSTGEPVLLTGLVMTGLVLADVPGAPRQAGPRRQREPG